MRSLRVRAGLLRTSLSCTTQDQQRVGTLPRYAKWINGVGRGRRQAKDGIKISNPMSFYTLLYLFSVDRGLSPLVVERKSDQQTPGAQNSEHQEITGGCHATGDKRLGDGELSGL
jgi:hypothetical protein